MNTNQDLNQEVEELINETAQTESEDENQEVESLQDVMFGEEEEEVSPEETAETDPKETADTKAEEEPEPEPEPEDIDMPEGLGEKAQERFRTLANENREYKQKAQEWLEVSESVQELQNMMQESFNNTEEVMNMFDYGKAVRNGDWETVGRYLQEQVSQFETLSGKKLENTGYFGFQDLQQKVEDFELSEEDARQLAIARKQNLMYQQQQQTQQQTQQQQQQQMQELESMRQSAIHNINQLSNEWSKSDLLWAEREPQMIKFIQDVLRNEHPSRWEVGIRSYYEALKRVPTKQPTPSPLRARPSIDAQSNPKDLMEAMFGDLN